MLVDLQTFRVLVVSDVRLYRDAVCELLAAQPQLRASGSSGPARTIMAAVDRLQPDVVLLDGASADALPVARALQARDSQARVVVTGVAVDVLGFAEANVAGLLTPDVSSAALVEAVVRAGRGAGPVSGVSLTARENEVLRLLEAGFSNKEIAARLFIGLPTVKTHVHNILRKLGASRRGQAAARARAVT